MLWQLNTADTEIRDPRSLCFVFVMANDIPFIHIHMTNFYIIQPISIFLSDFAGIVPYFNFVKGVGQVIQ